MGLFAMGASFVVTWSMLSYIVGYVNFSARRLSMDDKKAATAVVLLSGGMDSVTCLAKAVDEGFSVFALSFQYGQRHGIELEMARYQAQAFTVREHKILAMDLAPIAPSSLTGVGLVPKDELPDGIPSTYVPGRNTVFLSLGLAWAEVLGASHLFVGVNQVDYSGYPDCRGEFIEAFEKMANLATKAAVEGRKLHVRTPLLDMDKPEIIQLGLSLGVDYAKTLTCYDPTEDGKSCGRCPSCLLRLKAFKELGMKDPAPYIKIG